MHLHPIRSAILIAGVITALAIPSWAAFDRNELLQHGEDYVLALHDAYLEAAAQLESGRHPEIPRFFKTRASAIEDGEEIFPADPKEFPIADELMSARLDWAYEETYDITTSEAGDMEPALVAQVQIAYEQWLITMHIDPKDADAEDLASAFDQRLDDLTSSPLMSALEPSVKTASLVPGQEALGFSRRSASRTETALGIALPRRTAGRI